MMGVFLSSVTELCSCFNPNDQNWSGVVPARCIDFHGPPLPAGAHEKLPLADRLLFCNEKLIHHLFAICNGCRESTLPANGMGLLCCVTFCNKKQYTKMLTSCVHAFQLLVKGLKHIAMLLITTSRINRFIIMHFHSVFITACARFWCAWYERRRHGYI